MNSLLHQFQKQRPIFKINSAQMEILKEPVDFYVNLHRGIRSSSKRIVWSTLYIGYGNMEDFLIESVSNQQRRFEQLRISMLMDFYRGTRYDTKKDKSPIDQFRYLRMNNLFAHNMQLGLMRHPFLPQFFDQMLNSPIREIFNVHHMKWYIFDDKVILSGANLEEQYFTNRQDRYIVFHEVPELADYLDDAQSALLQHSYLVDTDQSYHFDPFRSPPTRRGKYFEEFQTTWKMFNFSYKDQNDIDEEDLQNIQEQQEQQEQEQDQQEEELNNEEILQYYQKDLIVEEKMRERKEQVAEILSKSFNTGAIQNVVNRLEKTLYKSDKRDLEGGEDAYVLITLHVPYLQTDQDKQVMTMILNSLDQMLSVQWVSGYMNFSAEIIKAINNCKSSIKLLTASPSANGFHKAGKYKSYIPYFYREFESQIEQPVYEYKRPNWTFHTKGFWGELNDGSMLTIVGSSNYAQRSINRDNEIQAYILTKCPQFKEELQEETRRLFEYSEVKSREEIRNDKEMKLNWRTKLLSKIFRPLM